VVAKAHPGERVGVFARRAGRLEVVEYSELDPGQAASADPRAPPHGRSAAVPQAGVPASEAPALGKTGLRAVLRRACPGDRWRLRSAVNASVRHLVRCWSFACAWQRLQGSKRPWQPHRPCQLPTQPYDSARAAAQRAP